MEQFTIFQSPIPVRELSAVEALLRNERIFCTSFPDQDAYSVSLYHSEAVAYETSASIVLDRNVFSRVVELAGGKRATRDHRIAAAVMAFGQCANMMFEPALALYEGTATQSIDRTIQELTLFRAADNVHPSAFADIALEKASTLPTPLALSSIEEQLRLPERIRQYSFVYPLVLKIGLIEVEGGPMAQRMIRFLSWMYDNWYMSAPATHLAALCFSGSPPRDMLKGLRAEDRNVALKGLRNCAWDLTYVTWWGELLKKQNGENRLYLFCTRDKALRNIAQQLLAGPGTREHDVQQRVREFLGVGVYKHYVTLMATQNDAKRAINGLARKTGAAQEHIVAALETALLQPI